MRTVFAVTLTLCLTACGPPQLTCAATEQVRVEVHGQAFAVPVDLRPSILGASEHARLPSFRHRDAQGRSAYCQEASEPPAQATSVSFYPRTGGMNEVDFMIIGRAPGRIRPTPSNWPVRKEAGFEVTKTKGPTYVFSAAGSVRPTPVGAICAHTENGVLRSCRVSFVTRSGVEVMFDLGGAHPLSNWPESIAKVDAYVADLEMGR